VRSFDVELFGAEEVPPVDTGASGQAELEIDVIGGAVSGTLEVSGMTPTMAHIHLGHAGSNGPILIHLEQDSADPTRFEVPMSAALTTAEVDLLLNGGLYVNVHSEAHPAGELRGQILPEDFSLVFAELSGAQQIPVQDTQARGFAAVTLDESVSATAIVHLTLFGLGNATGVDLHQGYAGTRGETVAQLGQSTTDPNHWFHDGVELDDEVLESLLAGRIYLDASNAAFPDGLIRGQFVPDGIALVLDQLSGRQEVPPVMTDAAGTSALTLDLDSLQFNFHVNTTEFDHASDAHIHDGFAGTNGPVLVPLQQDAGNPAHWSAAGSWDQEELEKLLAGALYVNVHSPEHPPGEIRAQLEPENIEVIFADLDGDQVVPPVATIGTGLAAVTVDKDASTLVAHLRLTDVLMSTSGGVHAAPAGENGPELVALEQDPMDVDHWFVPEALLDADSLAAFLEDGLYVLIGSQAHPDGEIRGQLVRAVPPGIPQAPVATITAPEDGAEVSDAITITAEIESELDIVEVRFLADGELINSAAAAPYSTEWNTSSVADGEVMLTVEAEDELGNVGVSAPVSVTVANDSGALTLAEIQAQVFTPRCAVCHMGAGNELPFSMNLSNAQASFDHLVDVASEQVPALLRVDPFNPDDSYLIHKLEGTQTIGDRMPQGGPFLDDHTIQGIRGWIADGATAD
jgi:hypothetical protein